MTLEQEIYRQRLVYMGIWKDINYSAVRGVIACWSVLCRKLMKSLLHVDIKGLKLYWHAWVEAYSLKKEIILHRQLSKKKGAFL